MRLSNRFTLALFVALAAAGCASTPEQQQREADKQQVIESILTEASDFSEAQRCLRPNEFRSVRILDDQHLLFEGRRGRQWLNALPMRCPGLDRNSILSIDRMSGVSSLCRLDSFTATDWIDWPWYRRWPWRWISGPRCSLGSFQAVNEAQVEALKEAIKAGRH